MKVNISVGELQNLLQEQLEFLECSCLSFDNGFEGEAKRLAVTARVLVHDTPSSLSLLNSLNIKDIAFVDTSIPFEEQSPISHSSLVATFLHNTGSKIVPLLDGGPFCREISFNAWWNGIVFVDGKRNEFSRKDIVLALANKEGGAHVDTQLDETYYNLRKNNSLQTIEVTAEGKGVPGADQVPATMRQIAHELLKTLRVGYTRTLEKLSGDGIVFCAPRLVTATTAPSRPEHNLPKTRPVIDGRKIGRNDPCACGSGKKYKKCCIA